MVYKYCSFSFEPLWSFPPSPKFLQFTFPFLPSCQHVMKA